MSIAGVSFFWTSTPGTSKEDVDMQTASRKKDICAALFYSGKAIFILINKAYFDLLSCHQSLNYCIAGQLQIESGNVYRITYKLKR